MEWIQHPSLAKVSKLEDLTLVTILQLDLIFGGYESLSKCRKYHYRYITNRIVLLQDRVLNYQKQADVLRNKFINFKSDELLLVIANDIHPEDAEAVKWINKKECNIRGKDRDTTGYVKKSILSQI